MMCVRSTKGQKNANGHRAVGSGEACGGRMQDAGGYGERGQGGGPAG